MQGSGEGFYIHVGRGWTETLAHAYASSSRGLDLRLLYTATAYVDVAFGTDVVFRLPRVVRVLPFIFSLIDQLAQACAAPAQRWPVNDGAEVLVLAIDATDVLLETEAQRERFPLTAVVAGLRAVVYELYQDIQELPAGEALLPVASQLALADTMLGRMDAPGPYRRGRRRKALHVSRPLDLFDVQNQPSPPQPARVETLETLLEHAEPELPHGPVLRNLQFLELEHSFEVSFASDRARDVFFGTERDLLLLFPGKALLADCVSGLYCEIQLDAACARQTPRRFDDCVVFPTAAGARALHASGRWTTASPVVGANDLEEILGLVATRKEVLAYLRGMTVYDAPTGVALLHDISSLVPRWNAAGEVVGWYAVDTAKRGVWWDGDGDVALFFESEETVVNVAPTRHGAVVLFQCSRLPLLRWLTPDGAVAWERSFESRGGEGYSHYKLQVWRSDEDPSFLSFAVVAGHIWWAFRIHTRTRLATLVLHHREVAPVRLEWADEALVVATGDRLRAYPLEGRAPDALWEERVPNELGLLAPVFPIHVQGDLLAYATGVAVVRRLRTGEKLAEYRGNWTAVFDLRLDSDLGVVVVGALPGHLIELYRADAAFWLGVVP